MKELEIKAYAKINLALDVIRKRPDGYHDIRTVMHTIGLHDDVFIKRTASRIEVKCDKTCVPEGPENIAYKAAEILKNEFNIKDGISIEIHKKIPVGAGLAGGSADAAAVFKGINEIFSLGLTTEQIMKMGRKTGADVPFCIKGGTALAEGIGDVLSAVENMPPLNIVIVKPDISVSTAWAYQNIHLDEKEERPDIDKIIKAIKKGDIKAIASEMKNVFEKAVFNKYPRIKEVKDKLLKTGALGSVMSGSGSAVFGIYESGDAAKQAYENIRKTEIESYLEIN